MTDSELNEGFDILEVTLVLCRGPWQMRVVSSFLVELDGSYPASKTFNILALENCDRSFNFPLVPSPESWSLSDRTVICAQKVFGIPHSDLDKLDNIINPYLVEIGECFNSLNEGTGYEILSCTEKWQYRIVGMIPLDSLNEFPGDEFVKGEAIRNCDRRGSLYFPPTLESWEDYNDRFIYCVQEGQGLAGYSQERLDQIVDISKLNAGECFNENDQYAIPLVEIVSCEGPWQSRLLNSFIVELEGPYPGESYFAEQAFDRCDRLYDFYLMPVPEQWDVGYRSIDCIQTR
ncbi:MAG: hypothetical protein IIC83_07265 [Chloroflexi bacterium]|nr:hypothetical protein [Chloroflexota bacterium]